MALPLDLPKKRAADEAADQLRADILRGHYAAGDALPPERELAERLGVSRLTLRAALARLESEGLVRPVHGSGNRVLDFRETGGVELLGHLAAQTQAGGVLPVEILGDLLELRRMLAVEVVGLAAERATPEDLRALRDQVRVMATTVHDPANFMHADLAFARLMVRAAHNLAMELVANTMVRILESQPGLEAAFLTNPGGTVEVYGRLLELVGAREAQVARRTTGRLLTHLDATIMQRVRHLAAALQGENR